MTKGRPLRSICADADAFPVQIISWPDGSRSAFVLPSSPPGPYSVFVGPQGWAPVQASLAYPLSESWDAASVVDAARARLNESGVLKHGTEWCVEPPTDWSLVKNRLDKLFADRPDAALPSLLSRSAGAKASVLPRLQRPELSLAAARAVETDPVDALVLFVSAVAELRDAVCGYAA